MIFSQLLDEIVATEPLRQRFRQEFPFFNYNLNDKNSVHNSELENDEKSNFNLTNPSFNTSDLIYFDSGATSLRPKAIIDDFAQQARLHASIDRSSGKLSNLTHDLYQQAKLQLVTYFEPNFVPQQLVFTNNATDSLNIIAELLTDYYLQQYDAWTKSTNLDQQAELLQSSKPYYVILCASNHHANLLPWEKLLRVPNIELVLTPILPNGQLDLDFLNQFLAKNGSNCLLVSVSTVVNINGIVNDIKAIRELLNQYAPDCFLCLDHAQASTFTNKYYQKIFGDQSLSATIDKSESKWGADFIIGSLHKMYGFTGLGYLIVGKKLHNLITKTNQNSNPNLALLNLFNQKLSSTTDLTHLDNSSNQSTNQSSNQTAKFTLSDLTYKNFNIDDLNIKFNMSRVGGGHVDNVSWKNSSHQFKTTYKQQTNPFDVAGTSNLNTILTIPALFNWYSKFDWNELNQATSLLRDYIIDKLSTFVGVKNLINHPNPASVIQSDEELLEDSDTNDELLPLITYILPSDSHHILLAFSDGQDDEVVNKLSQAGFIVRVGRHCCHPLHNALQLDSTLRITLSPFNTFADAYKFCDQMLKQINNALTLSPKYEHLVQAELTVFSLEHSEPYNHYLK